MSPSVLLTLIAGAVFVVFILLALILWSIRIRRAEEGFEPTPPGLRKNVRGTPEVFLPVETAPPGSNPENPLTNLLRKTSPEISTLMDLDAVVKSLGASGNKLQSAEERREVFSWALNEMLKKQPDNTLIRQMLVSLKSEATDPQGSQRDTRAQVFRVGGKTTIRVDGVEFAVPEDIPDPAVREQVRGMIDGLDRQKPP